MVSVTGFIDGEGVARAVGCSRKVSQWGGRLGIGTMFEMVDPPLFLEHALDAVRHVLGVGIFELEVLHDRESGEYWAIDLNPRGFGQMSLDVARGNDLPRLWYSSATGIDLPLVPTPKRVPELWRMGVQFYTGVGVDVVRGPDRIARLGRVASSWRRPTAAAVHSWTDLRPGLAFAMSTLRHPGGLVRPFLER